MPNFSSLQRIWIARVCIGVVFFFNVLCAVQFLISPQDYAPSFELNGDPGAGMIRGLGILFLMWNVPYALALWNPARFKVSLLEALVMQFIGAAGESLLLAVLPGEHTVLRASVIRFIIFDASGVVLLAVAAGLILRKNKNG